MCEEYYGTMYGHYTQIMWPDAREVGCAYYLASSGCSTFVCEYDIGNMVGMENAVEFKDSGCFW
jgi:hypothetical protein